VRIVEALGVACDKNAVLAEGPAGKYNKLQSMISDTNDALVDQLE
jgi:hypothetical protein